MEGRTKENTGGELASVLVSLRCSHVGERNSRDMRCFANGVFRSWSCFVSRGFVDAPGEVFPGSER